MSKRRTTTPPPKDTAAKNRMLAARRCNTKPEVALRSALHKRGLRYRIDIAPIAGIRSRPDIVFTRVQVAVYVDGCFWHGCPIHGTWPKNNAEWWREKIEANMQRDTDNTRRLKEAGWTVVRVWEHEDPDAAADSIAEIVQAKRITEKPPRRIPAPAVRGSR